MVKKLMKKFVGLCVATVAVLTSVVAQATTNTYDLGVDAATLITTNVDSYFKPALGAGVVVLGLLIAWRLLRRGANAGTGR